MFAEERDPNSPEDEAPEGAAGEPEENAPSDTPDEGAPVGPEIEGAEALSGAGRQEAPAGGGAAGRRGGARRRGARRRGGAAGRRGGAARPPRRSPPPRSRPPRSPARAPARPRARRPSREEEVIPGMHLEPDLVLEEQAPPGERVRPVRRPRVRRGGRRRGAPTRRPAEPEPVAHTPLDLAADARYGATGKRKSAVARVILKPGEGTFSINGRHLDEYFPRVKLQRVARQPLEAAGYNTRMDVVARIHGGGVSAQATALRHGIARALVEADPALRGELKRRGYLTRDPRVKERKKAGLKKARKRPQFSKR